MRIKLPVNTKTLIGGGITFADNFQRSMEKMGHVFSDAEYDVLFIPGATLAEKGEVEKAKEEGKKIILRVDNILEDRKNRNGGMSRLKKYADLADVIVYQSEWAKKLLFSHCGDGIVIHNGVNTNIFHPRVGNKNWGNLRIFYGKFSRNETKNFQTVQYFWREYCIEKKDDTLVLAGSFADDLRKTEHPFEFHNGEKYEYLGVVQDRMKLAEIMRGCDLAILPYQYDACSNLVLEAQACGLPVIYDQSGGTPEIIENGLSLDEMRHMKWTNKFFVELMIGRNNFDWEKFREKYSLEVMAEKYDALIRALDMPVGEI